MSDKEAATYYDVERDGHLAAGDVLLTLDDGTTERCQEAELYPAPELPTGEAGERSDRWSADGQVFFTGGYGWGVASDLSTVCLGADGEVVAYLKGSILPHNISQTAIEVLEKIRQIKTKGEAKP